MSVVVEPSARERFTPRELADAFKDFTRRGSRYRSPETGLEISAYWYGERVLIVYEESGVDVIVLADATSLWRQLADKGAAQNLSRAALVRRLTKDRPPIR